MIFNFYSFLIRHYSIHSGESGAQTHSTQECTQKWILCSVGFRERCAPLHIRLRVAD